MIKDVTLYVRVWIETNPSVLNENVYDVTLYVRVWIETQRVCIGPISTIGHPLREGVDWNLSNDLTEAEFISHPLREGVDWNYVDTSRRFRRKRHPLREGVDWNNITVVFLNRQNMVTLYVRVWIETLL